MPELPEVEHVRIGLAKSVVGRRVTSVRVHRADVVTGSNRPARLLAGCQIIEILRHGKQLAVVGRSPSNHRAKQQHAQPVICIHLGMTGAIQHLAEPKQNHIKDTHTHLVWCLDDGSRLVFRDPRRFGGVWTYRSKAELEAERWSRLGPDALVITARQLHRRLSRTQRCVKAALLDQAVVAGLGNIYVDELLFTCGVSPTKPACDLSRQEVEKLCSRMRSLLKRAIRNGGSTLRDYRDSRGQAGRFQNQHRVYGRKGQPCDECGTQLMDTRIAGRATVFCPVCQG